MTDAECGKVGNDRRRLGESKVAIKLQAIGRTRDVRAWLHDSKNHTTDQAGSVFRFKASAFTCSLAYMTCETGGIRPERESVPRFAIRMSSDWSENFQRAVRPRSPWTS